MVPEQKRRSRPMPTGSQGSKKRQKIADTAAVTPKDVQSDVKKLPVAADALPWNEVEMPEMFDDAEGFFGLEEIDDVDVVRDGNKVQFISKKKIDTSVYEEEFEGFDEEDVTEGRASTPEVTKKDTTIKKTATQIRNEKKKKKREKLKREALKKADSEASAEAGPKKSEDQTEEQESQPTSKTVSNIFAALQDDEDSEVDVSAWHDLDLSSEMIMALSKLGFSTPTLIQESAIPQILEGHDVIGKASTGSGKTLAFGIPVVEKWLETRPDDDDAQASEAKAPTALILSPTRELAHQLTEHIKALCNGLTTPPYIAAVTGGLSVQKQQRQLAKADIIIATPGRMWEVMSSDVELNRSLKQVKFLVIDEADRLLTEGHFKEATEILGALDRQVDAKEDSEYAPDRQTLVFSATFNKELQRKLAGKGKGGLVDKTESMEFLLKKLNFREEKPKFIDVNPQSQMAEGLKEGMVECAGTEKDLYLYLLLLYHPNQRTLIFTNSIHSVRRLTPLLTNLNLPAYSLHSQMAQKARMRSIERFSSPKNTSSILVATDVAARGLDIGGINLVIHYHLPRTADMYVHRSGRTARASAIGSSILMCAPEEVVGTRRLVAKVHAQNAANGTGPKSKYYMRSLDIDRKVVARLKPRVTLAKKISDSAIAKEKKGHDDDWVKKAAEELGVDYDSDELEARDKKGRGTGRKRTEMEARAMSKGDVAAMRAELKELLSQRVNVGTSERYLTSGTVDINALLKGVQGEFLGQVDGIGLE